MTVNTSETAEPEPDGPSGTGYGGRIRRGPMAADAHFTQISNALFRDPRVSYKAKGIFGLISTHRDGFGIKPETIARSGTEGVAAIKTGLQELERFGYLDRAQARREDGTLGPVVYYITDMPRSEPVGDNRPPVPTGEVGQNRRSEPVDDYPLADEPLAADRRHKNTNSKHTKLKNPLSPRLPQQPAEEPPATDKGEREIPADAQKIATAWAHAKGLRAPRTEKAIAADAQTLLDAGADLDHLCRVAAWMAAVGYSDLERAMTHKGAPKPIHQQRASPDLETCDRCRHQGRPGWIDYTDEATGRDKTTRCTHASEQAA